MAGRHRRRAPGVPPLHALTIFNDDHTLVYGESSAISSLTPGVPVEYTSPGVGVWAPTARGCRYKIVVIAANARGVYTRTSAITGAADLDSHGGFTGPAYILVTHPDHTRMTIVTTMTAVRIAI